VPVDKPTQQQEANRHGGAAGEAEVVDCRGSNLLSEAPRFAKERTIALVGVVPLIALDEPLDLTSFMRLEDGQAQQQVRHAYKNNDRRANSHENKSCPTHPITSQIKHRVLPTCALTP